MSLVTRAEYLAYWKSLEGGYGPTKGLANNDNPFNTWYYGRRVSGNAYAWCFAAKCYVQNHFGILTANGGKEAYCPNAKSRAAKVGAKVITHPSTTHGWLPGDDVYFDFNRSDEPEHTGTFVAAVDDHTFLSVEGNTETTQWPDALALRERHVADVEWYIEVKGFATAPAPSASDMMRNAWMLGAA